MKFGMPWKSLCIAGAIGMTAMGFGVGAWAADSGAYFAGKNITLLLGTGAGSSYDLQGRIIARHLSKHIDGKPTIVPQNMRGGGSMIMMNHLYNVARKDGTALGLVVGGIYLHHILGHKGIKHDLTKMTPIFNPEGGSVVFFASKNLGLKKPADIMKVKKPLAFGHSAPFANAVLMANAGFSMLGVPVKFIGGYRNTHEITLATQRGELDIGWNLAPGAFGSMVKPMIDRGEVVPLFQSGLWMPKDNSIVPNPLAKDVPTFDSLYKEVKGKAPSGPLWDAWPLALSSVSRATIFLPPDVPQAARDALNKGLEGLCADPAYGADLKKLNFDPKCYLGQEAQAIADRSWKASAETAKQLQGLVPKGTKK